MKNELNLTDEQIARITPIIQDELNQMQAFREQGISPDTAGNKMEELRQNTELKLAQYLTQDQLRQWMSKQQPPKQGMGDGMKPQKGDENSDFDLRDQSEGTVN